MPSLIREPSEEETEQIKRAHNTPENPDLGPCRCPVCRPDPHESEDVCTCLEKHSYHEPGCGLWEDCS